MASDLHCHTKLSDSSMGIDDLLTLAGKMGIKTLAITDRDCQAGTTRAKIIGERRGINVIPGVELSCTDSKRDCGVSIIGYLCDSPDRLEGLCARNMLASKKASQYMSLKVAQKFPITSELIGKSASGSTAVFIEHIMHALMECGFTDSIHGELYNTLFSPESDENIIVKPKYPEPAEVLRAIHEAGGIAVLAHPGTTDSFELLDELIELGLDGVEVWFPGHTEEQTARLKKIASDNNLLSVGGTGFKGMYSEKAVCIGETGTPDADVKALLSYKTKMKKKLAQTEKSAEKAAE